MKLSENNTKLAFRFRSFLAGRNDAATILSEVDAASMAESLVEAVNNMCFNYEEFAKLVGDGLPFSTCNTMVDLFLTTMKTISMGGHDARNEATWRLAGELNRKFSGIVLNEFSVEPHGKALNRAFAEKVVRTHRTLQQSFAKLMLEIIREMDASMRKAAEVLPAGCASGTLCITGSIVELYHDNPLPFI